MLTLLLVVSFAIIGIGIFMVQFTDHNDGGIVTTIVGVILAALFLAIICVNAPRVARADIIDEKIAMYEEENKKIEQEIDRIVEGYLKHEKDTYTDLKAEDSPITLITLFPELKADELVQQQIAVYIANREEIKLLKEEKIDLKLWEWVLYFK